MGSTFRPSWGTLKAWLVPALIGGSLTIAASQITCAEVQQDWAVGDGSTGDGDGGSGDGGGPWHCFNGSASNEEQFLNHCTDAERIDRPSNIPPTTWDGKSPLPGTQ